MALGPAAEGGSSSRVGFASNAERSVFQRAAAAFRATSLLPRVVLSNFLA